jgi:hypothetical protein
MRINARLDPQTEQRIRYLTAASGASVSHVVREAIAVYHAQVRGRAAPPASKFLAHVGRGRSGRSDVASNLRQHLGEILDAKHGLKPAPRRP